MNRWNNRCTGEAVDPDGEILICQRHLALAVEMLGHMKGVEIIITSPDGDSP